MERIINILMERDGLPREEATVQVEQVKDMILEAEDLWEADAILMEQLGLEPDYMVDLLT